MHLTGEMYLFCLQLLPSTVKALPSHGNMFIASKKIPPNHCAMSFGVETIFSDPILSFCALSPLVWRAGHTRDGDSTNIWLPWQFGNPVSSVLDQDTAEIRQPPSGDFAGYLRHSWVSPLQGEFPYLITQEKPNHCFWRNKFNPFWEEYTIYQLFTITIQEDFFNYRK